MERLSNLSVLIDSAGKLELVDGEGFYIHHRLEILNNAPRSTAKIHLYPVTEMGKEGMSVNTAQ